MRVTSDYVYHQICSDLNCITTWCQEPYRGSHQQCYWLHDQQILSNSIKFGHWVNRKNEIMMFAHRVPISLLMSRCATKRTVAEVIIRNEIRLEIVESTSSKKNLNQRSTYKGPPIKSKCLRPHLSQGSRPPWWYHQRLTGESSCTPPILAVREEGSPLLRKTIAQWLHPSKHMWRPGHPQFPQQGFSKAFQNALLKHDPKPKA